MARTEPANGPFEPETRVLSSAPMQVRLIASLAAITVGCSRGEPPAPAGIDAAVSPLPPPAGSPATIAPGAGDADAATATAPADASAAPRADTDAGALPQTRDRPKGEGDAFTARAATLWEAVVHDDVERGMPFFFPLAAYEQVKDVGNPAADWRRRLVGAYKRDIHALHERLGDKARTAKLVRVEVPDARARWIDPDEEYNKIGYWRVYGTRFVYTNEDGGRERTFDVSSLISWRGEWYVVHLTGFK
jgi:hypothetical protein